MYCSLFILVELMLTNEPYCKVLLLVTISNISKSQNEYIFFILYEYQNIYRLLLWDQWDFFF